jgi:hypothetical protein
MPNQSRPTAVLHVILVGDQQTIEQVDVLAGFAAEHGVAIAAAFSFEPGQAAACKELVECTEIVYAMGRALSDRMPIWIPYPREDLGREQHFRRIGLVLQRHGLNLVTGTDLMPCPMTGGMSEIDFALRCEVQAIDELDRAALASASVETLESEIESILSAAARVDQKRLTRESKPESLLEVALDVDSQATRPAAFPSPSTPWTMREPALRQLAKWLTYSCGMTQSSAAQCLNLTKHRTPQGLQWRQSTVSALVNGRYIRRN